LTNSGYKVDSLGYNKFYYDDVQEEDDYLYPMKAFCSENYCVLYSHNNTFHRSIMSAFRYNSTSGTWDIILDSYLTVGCLTRGDNVLIGKNFILCYYPNPTTHLMEVYRKTGNQLEKIESTYVFNEAVTGGSYALGDNYYAYAYMNQCGYKDSVSAVIKTWNGTSFDSTNYYNIFNNEASYKIRYMELGSMNNRLIFSWNEYSSHEDEAGYLKFGMAELSPANNIWSSGQIFDSFNIDVPWKTRIVPMNGNRILTAQYFDYDNGVKYVTPFVKLYELQGNSLSETANPIQLPSDWQTENTDLWILQPANNSFGLARPVINGNVKSPIQMFTINEKSNDGSLQFTGTPSVPVLYQRIEKSGMGDSSLYTYSYGNGVCNEFTTPEYKNVTISQPGSNGRTAISYYSCQDSVVNGLNYKDLDGMTYKTDEYSSSSGNIVRETNQTWNAVGVDSINGVFNTEMLQNTTTTDGVSSVTSYTYGAAPYFQDSVITATNGDGTIRKTYMTYPQNYANVTSSSDAMVIAIDSMQAKAKNMVNKVIEKYVTQTSGGSEKVISGEINEYKLFNSTQILPWKQWKFNDTVAIPKGSYIGSSSTSTFNMDGHYTTLQQSYDSFDSYGNLLQTTDANGTVTSAKYGYNNTCPVAIIKNAKNSETSFLDFEDSTIGSWTENDNDNKGTASNIAHTGLVSRYLSGTAYSGIYKAFSASDLDTTGKYVLSGWVKTSGTQPRLLWSIAYNSSTNDWPEVDANGTGTWQYLESVVDLSKYKGLKSIDIYALNGNGSSYANCWWDDIRFYPADAEMSTGTYDPVTLNMTSKSDESNNPAYYEYDSFGRQTKMLAGIGGNKKLVEENRTQYSSKYSTGFSASMPNLQETILYSDPSGYSDFSTSGGWTVSGSTAAFNSVFDNRTTVMMQNTASIYRTVTGTPGGIARVDFYPVQSAAGNACVLKYAGTVIYLAVCYDFASQKFQAQLQFNASPNGYTTTTFSLNAPSNRWYTVEIERYSDGKVSAFVYPLGEGRIYQPGYYFVDSTSLLTASTSSIHSIATNSTYYLSNFYYGNPDRQEVFTDGLGRKLQEQVRHNDSTIVSSALTYDIAGRQDVVYKPYETKFSVTDRGKYDPSYVSNVNYYYNTGMGSYKYDPNATVDSLYTKNLYNPDPLDRVSETGLPGIVWSIGGGHDKRFGYSHSTDYKYYITSVTDEQGITSDTYKDIFGRTIKTIQNTNGLNLVTNYTYDGNDNLLSTTDPAGKSTYYTYNTLKQLTNKVSPDAGTVQYIYDSNGNLRFVRDANHKSTSINSCSFSNWVGSGDDPDSGSFTLVAPGCVSVAINNGTVKSVFSNGTFTVIIKRNGITVYSFSATASNNNVSGNAILPRGTYTYLTSTTVSKSLQYTISISKNYDFVYYKYDALNRVTEEGEYQTSSSNDFSQANANNAGFPTSSTLVWKQYFYDIASTAAMASGQRNLHGKLSYAQSYRLGNASSIYYYSYNEMGKPEWMVLANLGLYQKKLSYNYDMQGNVLKKDFYDYDGSNADFNTVYAYDNLNRLSTVKTQYATMTQVQDGLYKYYANGKPQRLQLGTAQGVDYTYNERDWLQMINQQNLGGTNNSQPQDPGRDGFDSGIPVDKFGEVIGYNIIANHIGDPKYQNATRQFSGNISWLMYSMYGVTVSYPVLNPSQLVGWSYGYDNANRLTSANFGVFASTLDGVFNWQNMSFYDANYSYDSVGNFRTLHRNNGTGNTQDDLSYTYQSGTNRLSSISGTSSAAYTYDSTGNVLSDTHRGIAYIIYNPDNLPVTMYTTGGTQINCEYDVNGSRVRNTVSGSTDNFYFNGADGKTEAVGLAVYDSNMVYNILGAGGDNIGQVKVAKKTTKRYYYFKDHLGSIKMTVDTTGTVVGYDDYYPYGLVMTGRSSTSSADGRYKFVSNERDASTGLDYFGKRYYDPWRGGWDQVDPWIDKYPGYSPYNYTLNNPLRLIDLKGKGPFDLSAISTAISNAISNFKEELANYTKEIMGADQESYKNTTIETEAQTNQERVENNGLSNHERAQVYSGAFNSFISLMTKAEVFDVGIDLNVVGALYEGGIMSATALQTAGVASSLGNDEYNNYLNNTKDISGTITNAALAVPSLFNSPSYITKPLAGVGIVDSYITFDLHYEINIWTAIKNMGR
jgi:RHS repeat-associated protein